MNRGCNALALAGLVVLSTACGRTPSEPLPEPKSEPKPVEPRPAESKTDQSKPAEAKPVASFGPVETGAFRSADEAYEATMVFFRKMIAIVDAGGTDCGKIGTGLKGLMDEEARWTARLKDSQQDEALRKEMATKSGKKIEDAVRPAMTTLTKCNTNADVKAFVGGLQK